MKEKDTSDLTRELMNEADIDAYIKSNRTYFTEREMVELLTALCEQRNLAKAAVARQAGMSEVYLYQVFSGRRKPSRDRLLCLCVGLETTLEEAQRLLKQAGYAPLYPRLKRDAIISFGIVHHMELGEINDKLFSENEKTLY